MGYILHCPRLFIPFQNNIKLTEMVSVYFNTTLDGYYQATVFIFFFLQGRRLVLSEVL